MLFVEDAHLLDEATAEALHLLVARGAGELLLVLACRLEWIRTSLPHGITELARGDGVLTVELGPLPGDAVAKLVKLTAVVAPPDEPVARIVELAEGNPFFALELARATPASFAGVLPGTVRQAVLRRLAGLGTGRVDALAALAVAGEEFELASVLGLTGLSEDAFALLDAALDAGVVVVSGGGYRFRHELFRQALTDELPGHRRLRLHRDAAQRLAEMG